VARRARGRGIGYRLRHQQVAAALVQRRPDGRPRYAYVTGRNRVGEAAAMWATNRKLGAYQVAVYHDQYGSETGRARYYRLPLRRHDRRAFKQPPLPSPVLDLGTGILAPTGDDHPLLVRARDLGVFDEAALTKLTISNFVTRPFVRYAEYLRVVAPRGTAHLYFTSSHDEQVDKTIRVLKHQRPGGRIAVGVRGGHMGHTTAAARSLTDWGPYQNRDGYFGWPLVPHPVIDADGMLEELDELVEKHGAGALLGVFVEAVQRGTGLALDQQAWSLLCEWRDRTGVPLVLNETTTGRYRSGHGMWWLDGVSGDPDVVLWWGGGQLGHIFCNDRTFVDTPLTFISTWDGDELSATRSLWQLYACAEAPVAELSKRLDVGLEAAGFPADEIEGLGLYRVLAPDPQLAEQLWRGLERFNIRLGRGADGSLVICPPVTVSRSAIDRLCGTLAVLLREVRR
jgi:4-aminobutyrate aminotransferase-like enzyme